MAKLTILGIENYENANKRSLFSNLVFPEGINKEDATNTILMRCGEFEPLYSDPSFLRDAISLWGRKWYKTFERWNAALSIEYNPLENYDRNETWKDTHTGTDKTNIGTIKTTDVQGEQTFDSTLGEMTITDTMAQQHTVNETKVSAFDSDSYNPSNRVEGTIDPHTDTHKTAEHTNSNVQGERTDTQTTDARTDSVTYDTTTEHNARIHGNIGVTTSQQMLESELMVARWNLLQHIADLFADEFTLMIY